MSYFYVDVNTHVLIHALDDAISVVKYTYVYGVLSVSVDMIACY